MQVFVRRSELTVGHDVHVLASFDDNVVVDPKTYGDGAALLQVPPSVIIHRPGLSVLAEDWWEKSKQQVMSIQASKLIDDVFPEYSQRNSTAELTGYIATYGADSSKWPDAARKRKTEIDRCWNYVNAVRGKCTAMMKGELPSDPTAGSNWPTRISPYDPQ